jgi:hypothetical protein
VNDLANRLVIVCRKATEAFLTIAGTEIYPFHLAWLFPQFILINMGIMQTIQLFRKNILQPGCSTNMLST